MYFVIPDLIRNPGTLCLFYFETLNNYLLPVALCFKRETQFKWTGYGLYLKKGSWIIIPHAGRGLLYSTAITDSLYVLIVHGFFLMSTLKR